MVGKNGTKNGAELLLAKSLEKPIPKDEPREPRDFHSHPKLSNHAAREIAVKARCDPRAVFKYLHGGKQGAMMRARIEEAMAACGAAHLVGYSALAVSVQRANQKQS